MTTTAMLINRGCDAKLDALLAEFGTVLAERILEAEAADFLWESRVKERYLGQHFKVGIGSEDDEVELSRMAIVSFLNGRWHASVCLVDGDGAPVDLLWKRRCHDHEEAAGMFDRTA